MKTHNHLYERIVEFPNLLEAHRLATRGRKLMHQAGEFNTRRERGLIALKRELEAGEWRPGGYTTHFIHYPKKRMISAAPFRDRIVQHALCRITMPLFERRMVHDLYSNRAGKGTHTAIARAQHHLRRHRFVLKADIRKFFPSMDHQVLKDTLRRTISCRRTLELFALITRAISPRTTSPAAGKAGKATPPRPTPPRSSKTCARNCGRQSPSPPSHPPHECFSPFPQNPHRDDAEENRLARRDKVQRLLRGGSWNNTASSLRCANRNNNTPTNTNNNNGFRCARGIDPRFPGKWWLAERERPRPFAGSTIEAHPPWPVPGIHGCRERTQGDSGAGRPRRTPRSYCVGGLHPPSQTLTCDAR